MADLVELIYDGKPCPWDDCDDDNKQFDDLFDDRVCIAMARKKRTEELSLLISKSKMATLSKRVIVELVSADGFFVDDLVKVGNPNLDFDVYMAAVRSNPFAIAYVPQDFHTHELCVTAVGINPDAMSSCKIVPTKEMYLAAAEVAAVAKVPAVPTKTREQCLAAVRKNGDMLEDIPDQFKRDVLICREAVRQNPLALRHVPDAEKDYAVCAIAVFKDGRALQYVPEGLRDILLLEEDIVHARNLNKIICIYNWGNHTATHENALCLAAVKQCGGNLRHVPRKYKTPDLVVAAISQDGDSIQYVDDDLRTDALETLAVRQTGYALRYCKDRGFDKCLDAVRQQGNSLKYVPEEHKSVELCLEAVSQSADALCYVPSNVLGMDHYLAAVRNNPHIISSLPYKVQRDPRVIKIVTESGDQEAIANIPPV